MRAAMLAASIAALLLPVAAAHATQCDRVLVFLPTIDYSARDGETRPAYLKRLRGEARSLCADLDSDGRRVCEEAVIAKAGTKLAGPRVILATAD